MFVATSELHGPAAPSLPPGGAPPEIVEKLARWRDAFPALDALIRSGAAPAGAMRRLGLTFWAAGQAAAAAEALGDSVALDGADAAVWLDLGFVRRASGQTRAACEAFETAAELAPDVARAWLALGLAAKEFGAAERAEAALERAVALDPALDDAQYALGLVCFEARRYAEAAHRWRPLAARGYDAPGLKLGIGQCEFFLGDFGAAEVSLSAHLERAPDDVEIANRLALLRFLNGAIHGGPQAALLAYERVAGSAPIEAIARTSVSLLAAYGYAGTALSVARAFLAGDADDPIHRYQLAALGAEPLARAPADYVAAYFDQFAETFDAQLYGVLQYSAPRKLYDLIEATGAPTARTVDLGCGTGAAGAILRARAQRLEGVDLSPKMLDKAAARGLYDALAQADMVAFLAERAGAFDLVFAADALLYLGDLTGLLEAAAGAIVAGGSLALTLETTTRGAYELTASGRFAHSPRALISAAAPWFSLRALRRAFLRLEAHRRVYGALIVLERR